MSLFNMSLVLNAFSTSIVTVRRPTSGAYGSDGIATAPTFTVFANVRTPWQNLRSDELRHMPEGDRTTSWQKIWPRMQLQTGDRVDHPTKGTFIVQSLGDDLDEGGFYSAFIRKCGDGES